MLHEQKSEAGAKALTAAMKSTAERCHLYQKPGHTAPQCRNFLGSKGQQCSKFSGECYTCGRRRHRTKECEGTKEGGGKGSNGKTKTSYAGF